MGWNITRRQFVVGAVACAGLSRVQGTFGQNPLASFTPPIGLPDRLPGDGFLIRHGYACENTWFNPGWWHTGEDWYVVEGDTAGALIYAVADGEVVFAGSEYPGRVVIVRHADDLYSMYGHLDYDLTVEAGEPVTRGQVLGSVLPRFDGRAPSHLHFEMRTFLTTSPVNGDAPRYGVACGFNCPPGPGYWPIDAPEHPSVMGWRNPTHVLGHRALPVLTNDDNDELDNPQAVVSSMAGETTDVWALPDDFGEAEPLTELDLVSGDRFDLLAIAAGEDATEATSALGYHLWYQLALPDGDTGWVRAAVPSDVEVGSDGRPSAIRFEFLPMVSAQL